MGPRRRPLSAGGLSLPWWSLIATAPQLILPRLPTPKQPGGRVAGQGRATGRPTRHRRRVLVCQPVALAQKPLGELSSVIKTTRSSGRPLPVEFRILGDHNARDPATTSVLATCRRSHLVEALGVSERVGSRVTGEPEESNATEAVIKRHWSPNRRRDVRVRERADCPSTGPQLCASSAARAT